MYGFERQLIQEIDDTIFDLPKPVTTVIEKIHLVDSDD